MAASSVIDARVSGLVTATRLAQRVLAVAGARPALVSAVSSAARGFQSPRRSTLLPAAVRVERSRARGRRGEMSEQTALTLWFGEGPALPAPGSGRARVVAGTALAVAGAAALGAATFIANQREAARLPAPRTLDETPQLVAGEEAPPRITG